MAWLAEIPAPDPFWPRPSPPFSQPMTASVAATQLPAARYLTTCLRCFRFQIGITLPPRMFQLCPPYVPALKDLSVLYE